MLVTIFTDASYRTKYELAGWACYIRSDHFTIKRAGTNKEVLDSNHAELLAVLNALTALAARSPLRNARLIIKTDSKATIGLIMGRKKGRQTNQKYDATLNEVAGYLARVESYRTVHVKAHVFKRDHIEYGSPKYSINQWCDEQSRQHLDRAILRHRHGIKKANEKLRKNDKSRVGPRRHTHRAKGRGAGPYKRARGIPAIEPEISS